MENNNWLADVDHSRAAELHQAGLLTENAELLSALERQAEAGTIPEHMINTLEVLQTKLIRCAGGERESIQY